MQVLPRSETFQRRFNLPLPPRSAQTHTKNRRDQKKTRMLWGLWWASLIAVSAIPSWVLAATELHLAWEQMDSTVRAVLDFPKTHRIRIPDGRTATTFEDTSTDLIAWHRDMAGLQKDIHEHTPVGSVQDSTLEFVFSTPTKTPREWRATAVSLYLVLAASLYFFDSLHIAIVLLQLNALEFNLAVKIKQLDDALEKTLEQLSARQLELAMLPLQEGPAATGQQLLCMQKIQVIYNAWNQINLGQNIRLPFRKDFVNLNLSLVFSVVVAVLLRSLEVVLLALWPNLPRFNLSKRLYAWLRNCLPGSRLKQALSADLSLYSAPSDLSGQPSEPTSLDLLFAQQPAGRGRPTPQQPSEPPSKESVFLQCQQDGSPSPSKGDCNKKAS